MVRIEPSLNRAVDFALGEGLVRRLPKDRIQLTPAGVALADEIDEREDLFVTEKQLVNAIGRKVTEALVSRIFGQGGNT